MRRLEKEREKRKIGGQGGDRSAGEGRGKERKKKGGIEVRLNMRESEGE